MRAVLLLVLFAACGKSHCKEISTNVVPGGLGVFYKGCSGGDHEVQCHPQPGNKLDCTCDGKKFTADYNGGLGNGTLTDDILDKNCGFTP